MKTNLPETPDDEHLQIIADRYRVENHFLACIRQGRTADALVAFDGMAAHGESYMKEHQQYRDPRIAYAVLRALIRKAAEDGGLSPFTIDRLTQRQSVASGENLPQEEQTRLMRNLVRDLTDGVRETQLESRGACAETKAILEYIHLHYSENIPIEALTNLTHYSKAHISTHFRRDTGRTVTQYIAYFRCRRAADLLRRTDMPVHEISAAVGYLDSNYFVKVFRRQFGQTPSAYRAEHMKSPGQD